MIDGEKEKLSLDSLKRQRSSKSLNRHTSRQGTGKTFATDRCVTSPLSVRGNFLKIQSICVCENNIYLEENARLMGLETPRPEQNEFQFVPPSSEVTVPEAKEGGMVHNTPHTPESKSDDGIDKDDQQHGSHRPRCTPMLDLPANQTQAFSTENSMENIG